MKPIVATLTSPAQNARNLNNKLEMVETLNLVGLSKGAMRNVINVRFYMGRSRSASVVHCSIWIRTSNGDYMSGYGTAGGYGYHKTSQAFAKSVESAGLRLSSDVGGVGDSAIEEALIAIAKLAGYRNTILVRN